MSSEKTRIERTFDPDAVRRLKAEADSDLRTRRFGLILRVLASRVLEQTDRLPDLQSDFTSSQYKMVFKKSKELRNNLRDTVSPQKLKELLEEMERLGRKSGGNWNQDASEGMEALEGGHTDKAMEAMQKALDKMRAQDEASRGGKNLRGGREGDRRSGREGGRGDGSPEDQDFGEGDRRQREVRAAQAVGQVTDHRAGGDREHHAHGEANPRALPVARARQRGRVRADAEERGVAE